MTEIDTELGDLLLTTKIQVSELQKNFEATGGVLVPINPGDLLLLKTLELVVVDTDHNDGRFSGRRLSDGTAVEVVVANVHRVYPGSQLAPEESANA